MNNLINITITTIKSVATDSSEYICIHCNRLRHKSFLRKLYSFRHKCIIPCIGVAKNTGNVYVLHKKHPENLINPFINTSQVVFNCSKCNKRKYRKNLIRISINQLICKTH